MASVKSRVALAGGKYLLTHPRSRITHVVVRFARKRIAKKLARTTHADAIPATRGSRLTTVAGIAAVAGGIVLVVRRTTKPAEASSSVNLPEPYAPFPPAQGPPPETESAPLETAGPPPETESAPLETAGAPPETESAPLETAGAPPETESAPLETQSEPPETADAPPVSPTISPAAEAAAVAATDNLGDSDDEIVARVEAKLFGGAPGLVKVEVSGGVVTLSGPVDDEEAEGRFVRDAEQVEGVKAVRSELQTAGAEPGSPS